MNCCSIFRNWIVGKSIIGNIVNSIEKSRKTVLVLSNSFARSKWGDMEMSLAQNKLLTTRRYGGSFGFLAILYRLIVFHIPLIIPTFQRLLGCYSKRVFPGDFYFPSLENVTLNMCDSQAGDLSNPNFTGIIQL